MKKSILTLFSQKLAMLTLVCGVLVFASCTKKSDPAPATSTVALPATVVGKTYTGDVAYTNASGVTISSQGGNGKVTVTETGTNTYTISFSAPSGVPSLTGMQFTGAGSFASVSSGGSVSGITITETAVSVGVAKDGATWGATATR